MTYNKSSRTSFGSIQTNGLYETAM